MVLNVLRPRFLVYSDAILHGPAVHHQQGHDGVVVGCGGQLHLSVGCQFAVHGKHVPHVLVLSIQHVGEVRQIVLAVLHEQCDEPLVPMTGIVGSKHIVRGELIEVPQHLQVEEILGCKEFIVHDGGWLQVVEGHVVEFFVPSAGRIQPTQFFIALGDVVNPSTVPERLELHRVKFKSCCVGITSLCPRALGDVRVDVEGLVEVVIDQLFNERRHQIVRDFGVCVSQNSR